MEIDEVKLLLESGKWKIDSIFQSGDTNFNLDFKNEILSYFRPNESSPRKTEKYKVFNDNGKINISIGIGQSEICAINESYMFLKTGETYAAYLKVI